MYTKGDWKVVHEFNVEADNHRAIASCGYSDNRDPDTTHRENVANAQLIAAAPRMANLLERLANDGWNAYISEEAREILSLIAKADGGK